MSKLVRKSSFEGRAPERSSSGFGSGCLLGVCVFFLHLLVALFLRPGEGNEVVEVAWLASLLSTMSSGFFLFSSRFMMNLNMLVGDLLVLRRGRKGSVSRPDEPGEQEDILCVV